MTRPITGEPTHGTEDEKPRSQDPKITLTSEVMSSADDAWSQHYSNDKQQNNYSASSPNISEPYSPLETLIEDGFSMYGNMSVESLDASLKNIMLRYANSIVEEIRAHPYASTPDLDYYRNLQDTRPIPDIIMQYGLAYYYAKWQKSDTTSKFKADYYEKMNTVLYNRKYGAGKIELDAIDKPAGGIR